MKLLTVFCDSLCDLDWEVREIALEYWAAVAEDGNREQDFSRHMEDSWCATALTRAMAEKDVRFRGKLTLVLDKIRSRIDEQGEKSKEERASLAVDSAKVSFDLFKTSLANYESVDPEKSLDEYCEVHQGLWSVVADIVQSVEASNQLDSIDCV